MNKPISEAQAWEIAREFATEATSQDVNRYILGIFMIGSLAAKQYRPGWSDIDTVIVARNSISDEFRASLKEMRASYQSQYGIPKGFGGIILREQDLKPPYDPEERACSRDIQASPARHIRSGENMIYRTFLRLLVMISGHMQKYSILG